MFTGIIQKTARITDIQRFTDSIKIRVDTGLTDLVLGESIAINGVCLTVSEFNQLGEAFFFLSSETVRKSSFSKIQNRARVNLERALQARDRLSGHIVQGHVDGVGKLVEVHPDDEAFEIKVALPRELTRYCVEKGSIALNGISLTLNRLEGGVATVMIIPHTWKNTNLSSLDVGGELNVEVDILAKYVEKLCQPYPKL